MKSETLYFLEQKSLPSQHERHFLGTMLDKISTIYDWFCSPLVRRLSEGEDTVIVVGNQRHRILPDKIYEYYISRKPCLPAAFAIYEKFGQRLQTYYRGLRLEEIVKGRLVNLIAESIRLIETTKNICAKYRFKKAKILDGASMAERALQTFCKHHEIPVKSVFPFSSILRWVYDRLERRSYRLKGWSIPSRFPRQNNKNKPPYSPRGDSPHILFLAFHVNHLNLIESLVEKLPSNFTGVLVVQEYLYSIRGEALDRLSEKIRVRTLESYVTEENLRTIRDLKAKQREEYPTAVHRCIDVFTYEGVSLWPMIQNYFCQMIQEDYPTIMASIELVHSILRKEKPNLILGVTVLRYIERIFFISAQQKGIPTLVVYHASFPSDYAGFELADYIACHGPKTKEMLEEQGIPNQSIKITGNPIWDKLFHLLHYADRTMIRNTLVDKLGLDPELKLIVFTSQPVRNIMTHIVHILKGALKRLPQLALIIKVHPEENITLYNELLNGLEDERVRIVKSNDIHKILLASDIVVTWRSTTGFEAIMLEKPVITVDLQEDYLIPPYFPPGATLHVHDLESLTQALRKLAYDQEARKTLIKAGRALLYDFAYKQDGHATDRVFQFIREIVGS